MTSSLGPAGTERTTLAWQRTALSLVIAAALLARLTADQLGLFSLSGLVVVAPLTLWVALTPAGAHDGRPATGVCLSVVTLGLVELTAIVHGSVPS